MYEPRDQLSRALAAATVGISADSRSGTGFFVGTGLVLTCAHVLHDATGPVTGRWKGRELELTRVDEWYQPGDEGGPDLALLRVADAVDATAVGLADVVAPGDELYVQGYPDGAYRAGDSVVLTAQGPSTRSDDVVLERADGQVTAGFSGSPVLNWRTGMVCAVVRIADNTPGKTPLVRLTPVSAVLDAFAGVLVRDASASWRDILSDSQLRSAESRHPGSRLRAYLRAILDDEAAQITGPFGVSGEALAAVHQAPRLASADGEPVSVDGLIGDYSVLTGEAGVGKSSLLRLLRRDTARRLLAGEPVGFVPVLVKASALDGNGRSRSARIADAVGLELGHLVSDPLVGDDFRGEALPGTPWLLLADGFDEILRPEVRLRVLGALATARGEPYLRVLLATRPLPPAEEHLLRTREVPGVSLLPFTPGQSRALVKALLGHFMDDAGEDTDHAARLTMRIEASQIADLARIPLVTTMLAVLYAADPLRELPQNRNELYEMYVQHFLDRQKTEFHVLPRLLEIAGDFPGGPDAVTRLLDGIRDLLTAYAVHQRGDDGQLPLGRFAGKWAETLRPAGFTPAVWHRTIDDLVRQTGLVVRDDFTHATIADYLAADHVTALRLDRQITISAATASFHIAAERSYLSFLAGGWVGRHLAHLRCFCERLADGSPLHLDFLVTLSEDGVEVPADVIELTIERLEVASNNPKKGAQGRVVSAALLRRLNRERAVPRLRLLAYEPRCSELTDSISAVPNLWALDATTLFLEVRPEEADALLRFQVIDNRRTDASRLRAARERQSRGLPHASFTFTLLITDREVANETRLDALRDLTRIDLAEAHKQARGLIRDRTIRVDAAIVLAEAAPSPGFGLLAELSEHSGIEAERCHAAAHLLRSPEHRPTAVAALVDLLAGERLTAAERWVAIAALSEAGHPDAPRMTEEIALGDGPIDPAVRLLAAHVLVTTRPDQAERMLPLAATIGAYEPALAFDLLSECVARAPQEGVQHVVDFLTSFSRYDPADDLLCATWFPRFAGLLAELDEEQCAAAMSRIVHDPAGFRCRREAEEFWGRIAPGPCADHLVKVATFRCRAGGFNRRVFDLLGGTTEAEYALARLSRVDQSQAVAVARDAIAAFVDDDPRWTGLVAAAAGVLAQHLGQPGRDILASLALDPRRDPAARVAVAGKLRRHDEAEADRVTMRIINEPRVSRILLEMGGHRLLGRDDEVRFLTGCLWDASTPAQLRAIAVHRLLDVDPDLTLRILLGLTETEPPAERAWADQHLRMAMEELEILERRVSEGV
ncbi:serine protease [Actinoplanes auranticolor]|uniref:NACHT domain-containing protein n=1 Tax=Actinoplanes auranticolor TaxID=47988 RepID=A0A919S4W7_9ACTN|nr:serine protease [Actinoplanes auranticolor]GIM64586.1 hypothetical protein Aau02nite_11390 [Actinoplanes auranticolor]